MNLFSKKINLLLLFLIVPLCSFGQTTVYFNQSISIEIASPVYSLTEGDFNSDGKTDIAISTATKEDETPTETDFKIYIYLQQENGSLLKSAEYVGSDGLSMVTSDFNKDGRDDILISSTSGFGILYQNDSGTFNPIYFIPLTTTLTRVAAGDFNSDGNIDVCGLNTNLNNGNLYISYQNNAGEFAQPITISTMKGESLFVTDLNNNGKDDIVLQPVNSSLYSNFAIISQDLSGHLGSPTYFDLGGEEATAGLAIGDINGDYIKDIILSSETNGSDYKLSVFLGSETGEFNFSTSYNLPFEPGTIQISDINMDSRNDVVVLHAISGQIGVYFQKNDGTLNDNAFYQVDSQEKTTTQGFVIADINSDNAPDLVFADPEIGFVTLTHVKPSYFIPHIANEAQWTTFLVVDNTEEDSLLEVLVTQRKDNGGIKLNSIFVDPLGSYSFPLDYGDWGTVEFKNGNGILRETFVNVEENGNGIAEFYLTSNVNRTLNYVLPHYNATNLTWMGISILNPWTIDTSLTLTAFDSDGTLLETVNMTLPARNHIATYIDTIFSSVTINNISRIHLTSDMPVTGINISGYNNERLLFTQAVKQSTAGIYSIPHIAKREEGWITKIILDNTSPSNSIANITLYNNGQQIGSYNFLVQGNGSKSIDVDTLAGDNVFPECGFVSTDSNNIIVRQSFLNIDEEGGGTAEFLLKNNDGAFLKYTYPFFKPDDISWRGIAIFNPTNTEAIITISAYTNTYTTSVTTLTLAPFSRYKGMLYDLFPGLPNYNHISRILLSSDQKLSGINISGSETARLLFGSALTN